MYFYKLHIWIVSLAIRSIYDFVDRFSTLCLIIKHTDLGDISATK